MSRNRGWDLHTDHTNSNPRPNPQTSKLSVTQEGFVRQQSKPAAAGPRYQTIRTEIIPEALKLLNASTQVVVV